MVFCLVEKLTLVGEPPVRLDQWLMVVLPLEGFGGFG